MAQNAEKRILVIIPAFNEEASILSTVEDLEQNFPQADRIVVNDCSKDGTRAILHAYSIPYLDLPLNLGIGGGVQTGYRYAVENGYDVTIQFDGDGQHSAAYLKDLILPVLDGEADMTVGSRFIPGTHTDDGFKSSAMRRLGITFLSSLVRLVTGVRVHDVTSGFRACGKDLTAAFAQHYAQDYPEPEAIVQAVVSGYRVAEVPVKMNARIGGVSSISPFKGVYYMIKVSLAVLLAGIRMSGRKAGVRHDR